ncbi:MAG: Holliday junction branch migration protein RuvA [Candidatus Delongbacteria bacterium]|jgi:Holliday junction DNA helicase RuvA|nr:Holliday junction branch migration protein RuvA [Candidatus Delongbacteria bacterium]
MIEMIIGEILHKEPSKVIVNCAGVGYSLSISSYTYSKLSETNKKHIFHTVFKVREDDMSLFGFLEKQEKEVFIILSTVSGIGAKTAMVLLSEIKYDRLYNAIATGDVTLISQAHGIGKKKAQKIVFELKDKISASDDISDVLNVGVISGNSEAVSGLVQLGYKNTDANAVVAKIMKEHGKDLSTQEIIRHALQNRMK